jgi:hypothetical protein
MIRPATTLPMRPIPWITLSRGRSPSLYASWIRLSRKTLSSMLSPNRIANSMTGRKEMIGMPDAPIRLAPMPSSNTATTTPWAAATDR